MAVTLSQLEASSSEIDAAGASRKEAELLEALGRLPSLLVAFSGGADSAYLAWAANRALGGKAVAITALSPSYSQHDREVAQKFVARHGIAHEWIETREAENPLYVANNPDRCYHCKDELFSRMNALERERGGAGEPGDTSAVTSIAYGINVDDTSDFRPGHRAAKEHEILAPLLDARLNKAEIRFLSQRAGLETWNRPASACLSSRVPYGTAVTSELLRRIENAEQALREMGFRQLRVRAHGETARVEIAGEELGRAMKAVVAQEIMVRVGACGFAEVAIDPRGYRQGSLNEELKLKKM